MSKQSDKDKLLTQAFSFKESLVGYAFCIVKNWQSAEDAVQEAFIIISEKWESYKPGASVFSWARGVVRFECFRVIRSLEREKPTEKDRLDSYIETKIDEVWNDSVKEGLHNQISLLRECVTDLPEHSKSLLLDFYLRGNSYETISKDIDKSLGFVKDNLFRLRKKLRSCVSSKKIDEICENFEPSPNPEFFDELYYGDLSTEQREVLVNELEASPESGELLHIFVLEHTALAIVSKQMRYASEVMEEELREAVSLQVAESEYNEVSALLTDDTMVPLEGVESAAQEKKITVFNALVFQSIAACLLLGVGLFWWSAGQFPDSDFAQISSITGRAILVRGDSQRENAVVGSRLSPGDILETESDTIVNVAMLGEASEIEVAGLSHFQVGEADRNKDNGVRFHLNEGEITATLARQSTDRPMVFSTPTAEVVVLGTRFKLRSTPSESNIDLFDGRVKLVNRSNGQTKTIRGRKSYRVSRGNGQIVALSPEPSRVAGSGSGSLGKSSLTMSNAGQLRFFHFENEPMGVVYDSSPFAGHGVYVNMGDDAISSGFPGGGLQFTGGGEYVNLGNDRQLAFKESFSIGFGVMVGREQIGRGCILANTYAPDGISYKITGDSSRVTMTVQTVSGKEFSVSAKDNFTRWKMVLFTLDNGVLRCYSGYSHDMPLKLQDSISLNGENLVAKQGNLYLGKNIGGSPFLGTIDEIAIYERPLTSEEVKQYGFHQHLRLNLDFDRMDNSFAYDASAFSIKAKIVGNVSSGVGVIGRSLALQGDGYIHIPVSRSIKGSVSFDMWIRGKRSENNGTVNLLSKEGAYDLKIVNEQQTKLVMHYSERVSGPVQELSCPLDLLDNQWHHVIASFENRDVNTLSVTVDERRWDVRCSEFVTNGPSGVFIGGSDTAKAFVGDIDQVRYFHTDYDRMKARFNNYSF